MERLVDKERSEHLRCVTRQIRFGEELGLQAQLRYFEIAPDGHSTLERHQHAHGVMILRGRGEALLGNRIETVAEHDLVSIPPLCWHQFRATRNEPLGFLCLVNCERDRPQLPTAEDLLELRCDAAVSRFIRS